MRKFKLLKELPGIEKGSIFESDMTGIDYSCFFGLKKLQPSFSIVFIEAHPEWFEEIKEEPEKNKDEKFIAVYGAKICWQCGATGPHWCAFERNPKKTVRRWLWDFQGTDDRWIMENQWLTDNEAEEKFQRFKFRYKKTTFNGQEVWQDFLE